MKRDKWISLLLACGMTLTAGGIGVSALPKAAMAAGNSQEVEVIVDPPTRSTDQFSCAMCYKWLADTECFLRLGTSWQDLALGVITTSGQEFNEVVVPAVGSTWAPAVHIWGVSVYEKDPSRVSQQSRCTVQGTSSRSVTGRLVDVQGRNFTISLPSDVVPGQYVQITAAYKGIAGEIYYGKDSWLKVPNMGYDGVSTGINGVLFTVSIYADKTLRLQLSESLQFSACSNTVNGYAAFAYSVV